MFLDGLGHAEHLAALHLMEPRVGQLGWSFGIRAGRWISPPSYQRDC